jgi:hypothetical protein
VVRGEDGTDISPLARELLRVLKAALAKELKLGPGDLNPLDEFDEVESCDDPRFEAWFRAVKCGADFFDAQLDWLTGRLGGPWGQIREARSRGPRN